MTWLARLKLGPLANTSVILAEPFGAVALPVGDVAAGLAVYGYASISKGDHNTPRMPDGELRYVFESLRAYTVAERTLFGFSTTVAVMA
jgi:hypothetical protein